VAAALPLASKLGDTPFFQRVLGVFSGQ
jgi:hypothetical protein